MDYVVHFEIPSDNPKKAQTFYSKLFGWKINYMKEFGYFGIKARGKYKGKSVGIDGGMMKRHAKEQTFLVYVQVKSIDDTMKKAKAAGAKVCFPKKAIGEMGYIAAFTDPDGNTIGLHEGGM